MTIILSSTESGILLPYRDLIGRDKNNAHSAARKKIDQVRAFAARSSAELDARLDSITLKIQSIQPPWRKRTDRSETSLAVLKTLTTLSAGYRQFIDVRVIDACLTTLQATTNTDNLPASLHYYVPIHLDNMSSMERTALLDVLLEQFPDTSPQVRKIRIILYELMRPLLEASPGALQGPINHAISQAASMVWIGATMNTLLYPELAGHKDEQARSRDQATAQKTLSYNLLDGIKSVTYRLMDQLDLFSPTEKQRSAICFALLKWVLAQKLDANLGQRLPIVLLFSRLHNDDLIKAMDVSLGVLGLPDHPAIDAAINDGKNIRINTLKTAFDNQKKRLSDLYESGNHIAGDRLLPYAIHSLKALQDLSNSDDVYTCDMAIKIAAGAVTPMLIAALNSNVHDLLSALGETAIILHTKDSAARVFRHALNDLQLNNHASQHLANMLGSDLVTQLPEFMQAMGIALTPEWPQTTPDSGLQSNAILHEARVLEWLLDTVGQQIHVDQPSSAEAKKDSRLNDKMFHLFRHVKGVQFNDQRGAALQKNTELYVDAGPVDTALRDAVYAELTEAIAGLQTNENGANVEIPFPDPIAPHNRQQTFTFQRTVSRDTGTSPLSDDETRKAVAAITQRMRLNSNKLDPETMALINYLCSPAAAFLIQDTIDKNPALNPISTFDAQGFTHWKMRFAPDSILQTIHVVFDQKGGATFHIDTQFTKPYALTPVDAHDMDDNELDPENSYARTSFIVGLGKGAALLKWVLYGQAHQFRASGRHDPGPEELYP